jgi:uncharacterized protein YdeI (YjbR/CyaY-like superfamily)
MTEPSPLIMVRSRAELRDWLSRNHRQISGIWLCTFKRPHPDYLPYETIVEELLCWGWIDSTPRKIDAERAALRVAPRNPKSAWSAINKAHVERARSSGAMTPAGEAKISAAKASGQWDFLNDVDALIEPTDLLAALDATGKRAFWQALPPSIRRGTLEWIKTAKTHATRAKRIEDVATSAQNSLRPSPFRR